MHRFAALLVLALSFLIAPLARAQSDLRVVVTVAPLKGLVQPLLPEGANLRVLMQPGRSEHGYEFSPEELADLARADVVVYIGLNLEPKIASLLADKKLPASQKVICFAELVGIQTELGARLSFREAARVTDLFLQVASAPIT